MGNRKTEYKGKNIDYYIFDPTGNITALVETTVDPADQPAVASGIMDQHPEVEQVGFVTFAEAMNEGGAAAGAGAPTADGARAEADVPVSLRMAGGEFCGNATMCAAALYLMENEAAWTGMPEDEEPLKDKDGTVSVRVRVSGAKDPLEVKLVRADAASFAASVTMPPALGIDELKLSDGMLPGSDVLRLPIVRMEGIAHVIIEPDSGFFGLKDDPDLAETLLRGWCGVLGSECLGMMFIDESYANEGPEDTSEDVGDRVRSTICTLTPLVYVPGADTMFWENSCASGSAAAGIYLAAKAGKSVDVAFDQPAGRLRVESDPATGKTVLHGSVVPVNS